MSHAEIFNASHLVAARILPTDLIGRQLVVRVAIDPSIIVEPHYDMHPERKHILFMRDELLGIAAKLAPPAPTMPPKDLTQYEQDVEGWHKVYRLSPAYSLRKKYEEDIMWRVWDNGTNKHYMWLVEAELKAIAAIFGN